MTRYKKSRENHCLRICMQYANFKIQKQQHTNKSFHLTFATFSNWIETTLPFKLHLKPLTGLVSCPSHKGTLPLTPARMLVLTTFTSISVFFVGGGTGKVIVTVEAFWLHLNAISLSCDQICRGGASACKVVNVKWG